MQSVRLTWANLLTLLRFALIPHICYAVWHAAWSSALSLFSIAAVTDVADGWFARWLHEETVLGQYLDPVVDKLMMISCYTMLTFGTSPQIVPSWFWAIMVGKEATMIIGGVYLWNMRKHAALLPAGIGKFAMGLQVGLVVWVFWALSYHAYTNAVCLWWLWAIAIATIAALAYYVVRILQQSGVSL